MSKSTILLVEDNDTLGYILKEYLELNTFNVILCKDGEAGWKAFVENAVDICILDIMMPKKDGFQLAEQIKNTDSHMPVIFLTARSLKIDKLKGFKLGADDYMVKPIEEEELVARIKAILRRAGSGADEKYNDQVFKIGNYYFDSRKRTLTINEHQQNISEKESLLLKMLAVNKNQLMNRHEALKKIWNKNDYFNRRSMDVHIVKLRKYLNQDKNISIVNVHGRGFILKVEESAV